MAGREKTEVGSLLRLPPPASLTVTIAIKGNSKSKDVGLVNWALDKFVAEGMFMFKLIHVRPVITEIRTAVGSFRLSDMRKEVVEAYMKEIHCQTAKKLLPYKKMCAKKKVHAEMVQIESDDVIDAISREIDKSVVENLVIGASSRYGLKLCQNTSMDIAESMPKFCTVYTVSKGKLSSFRSPDVGKPRIITCASRMIHSSTNESSFNKSHSQASTTGDDFVELVKQVLNRGALGCGAKTTSSQ